MGAQAEAHGISVLLELHYQPVLLFPQFQLIYNNTIQCTVINQNPPNSSKQICGSREDFVPSGFILSFTKSQVFNVLRNYSFSRSKMNYASMNNWVIKVVHLMFQLFYSTILTFIGDFF